MARSRFSPAAARLLLAMLAALTALGLVGAAWPATNAPHLVARADGDAALYRAIARRTAAGGDTPAAYYAAAFAEQRARGYPLRPAVTVREPLLALVTARLGEAAAARLFQMLALAATLLLAARLVKERSRVERFGGVALAAVSVFAIATPAMALWHEAWAALLLAAALALAGTRGWPVAIAVGLLAMLVRELALLVPLALLAVALLERRRAEAIGWAAALAAFALLFALHLHTVAASTRPDDLASPGWARAGGWAFVLSMTAHGSALAALPRWANALAVPLALAGWAGCGTRFANRVALSLVALILPFCFIGRPDNFYWGLLFAPLLPVGLVLAPRALAGLLRAATARQAAPPPPWDAAWEAGGFS